MEQDSTEKTTLVAGETWEIGEGWNLTAQSIDSRTMPRQALFVLSKDGIEKDIKVITQSLSENSPIMFLMTVSDSIV